MSVGNMNAPAPVDGEAPNDERPTTGINGNATAGDSENLAVRPAGNATSSTSALTPELQKNVSDVLASEVWSILTTRT